MLLLKQWFEVQNSHIVIDEEYRPKSSNIFFFIFAVASHVELFVQIKWSGVAFTQISLHNFLHFDGRNIYLIHAL